MERQDGSELKASWCQAEEVSTKFKSRSDRLGLRGMRAGPRTAARRRVWPTPSLWSACWADQEESCFWHTEETMQKPLRRNSCCPDSATHGWEEWPPEHRTERGGHGGAGTVPISGSHSTPRRPEWVGRRDRPRRVHGDFQHKQPKVRRKKKEIPTSEARGEVM